MIALPLIYFVILFLIFVKKRKGLCLGSIIILFYIFSSFFAIIIWMNKIWRGLLPELDPVPCFLYCIFITLTVIPFYKLDSNHISEICLSPSKIKRFIFICWSFIILNFLCIIVLREQIMLTLTQSFLDVRREYYHAADAGFISGDSLSMPLYHYIFTFIPAFSPILMLFFFWGVIYLPSKKIMNSLLLFCSSTSAIVALLTAARTQFVYWLMMFIVIYFLFKQILPKKINRIIMIGAGSMVGLGLSYFIAVSISRFENNDFSAKDGLIYYTGQPYLQFNNVYNHYTFDKVTINRTLPITSKWILGDKQFNKTDYRYRQESRIGASTGVFLTHFGDAMLDYGKLGMLLYVLIFYLISMRCFKFFDSKRLTLYNLIIVVLLLRVPVLGLFAYMYASIDYSILFLGSLLIAKLLK